MEKTIFTVIVVYNRYCGDSPSCTALSQQGAKNVLVADNSTSDYKNREYCEEAGWRYLSMNGNAGLARAYNRSAGILKDEADYLVWMDDDTTLDHSYYEALRQAAAEHPDWDVLAPTVKDEVGILSPAVIRGCAVERISSLSEVRPETITAINSGMAVKTDIFLEYQYDETYFLDYIDHAFIRDMKRMGKKIGVFHAVLRQRFSGNDAADPAGAAVRFRIFKKDFKHFCSGEPRNRLYGSVILLRRRLNLCIRYRSLSFLIH